MQVGDNLTSYPNLEVFIAEGAEELRSQLLQLRLPHKILSIYAQGGRHYAWVSLSRPIKKKVKKNKE